MAGGDKTKGKGKGDEAVVDLAARIGSRAAEPAPPAPQKPVPPPAQEIDA